MPPKKAAKKATAESPSKRASSKKRSTKRPAKPKAPEFFIAVRVEAGHHRAEVWLPTCTACGQGLGAYFERGHFEEAIEGHVRNSHPVKGDEPAPVIYVDGGIPPEREAPETLAALPDHVVSASSIVEGTISAEPPPSP